MARKREKKSESFRKLVDLLKSMGWQPRAKIERLYGYEVIDFVIGGYSEKSLPPVEIKGGIHLCMETVRARAALWVGASIARDLRGTYESLPWIRVAASVPEHLTKDITGKRSAVEGDDAVELAIKVINGLSWVAIDGSASDIDEMTRVASARFLAAVGAATSRKDDVSRIGANLVMSLDRYLRVGGVEASPRRRGYQARCGRREVCCVKSLGNVFIYVDATHIENQDIVEWGATPVESYACTKPAASIITPSVSMLATALDWLCMHLENENRDITKFINQAKQIADQNEENVYSQAMNRCIEESKNAGICIRACIDASIAMKYLP